RRSAAMASLCRVSCFSLANNFLRAASHSSRETTFGLSTVRVDIFHFSFSFVFGIVSAVWFFLRETFTATAASPPAETVLATTSPRAARQNGHMFTSQAVKFLIVTPLLWR